MSESHIPLVEDEVRRGGSGDPAGDVLDMLRATGAPDETILEVLDDVAADYLSGGFDRFVEVRLLSATGADDTIRVTIDEDRLRSDIAAAASKRLLDLAHG